MNNEGTTREPADLAVPFLCHKNRWISYRRLLFILTPSPPSRVSPASRKTTPALSKAAWIASNVFALGSVAPRSRFLMATSEMPEALVYDTGLDRSLLRRGGTLIVVRALSFVRTAGRESPFPVQHVQPRRNSFDVSVSCAFDWRLDVEVDMTIASPIKPAHIETVHLARR
jgi:hypothetical protein